MRELLAYKRIPQRADRPDTEDRSKEGTAMETQIRRIPVRLPAGDFEALAGLAKREERTVSQQASYLLRRSLATKNAGDPAGTHPDGGKAA